MRTLGNSRKLIIFAVGIIILVFLVMDFNNRMSELRRLSAEKDQVSAQVTSLVETQVKLETQIAYATSEVAVYKWAYETKRYIRPQDKLVVPIQAADSTPVPTPQPLSTPDIISNWQVWVSLFIDEFSP
jgi:hypothetical protein